MPTLHLFVKQVVRDIFSGITKTTLLHLLATFMVHKNISRLTLCFNCTLVENGMPEIYMFGN